MRDLRPRKCPISGETESVRIFRYTEAPAGEIGFRRPAGEPYLREIWQFTGSNHFVSRHAMKVATGYGGDYVDATYGGMDGMKAAFDRVVALPASESDNAGRLERIRAFAEARFPLPQLVRLLDVGAGLGVFPHAARRIGWDCTAIDPDQRAVEHIEERAFVTAVCADFITVGDIGRFDILTFNKVLEHFEDPVAMLYRAQHFLSPRGFVYIELPDGEMAAAEGAGREEFFIEHLHIFSFASTVMLADRAGFAAVQVERLREPSGKFSLRAFAIRSAAEGKRPKTGD